MNPDNIQFLERYLKNKRSSKRFSDYLNDIEHRFNTGSHHEKKAYKFWPFGATYFSALNPIYLFMVDDLNTFSPFPFVFVRDGFFTLANFFQKFPKPVDIKTKFIIHKNFIKFIPLAWKKNIWPFDYYINPKICSFNRPKRKKILLKGLVSRSVCSLQFIESKIKEVLNILKKDDSIEVLIYMPVSHEPFLDIHYERQDFRHFCFDVSGLIYDLLGSEVKIKGEMYDFIFDNPKDITFIDINERLKGLCDNQITNRLIFNGILPESIVKEPMGPDYYYPLSMNHGVLLSDEHPEDLGLLRDEIKEIDQDIYSKKHSENSYFYYLDNFVKYLPEFTWKGSVGYQ